MRTHPGEIINRNNLAPIVCKAYNKAFQPATIHNGFKASGVYPYNPSVVKEQDLAPSTVLQTRQRGPRMYWSLKLAIMIVDLLVLIEILSGNKCVNKLSFYKI